MTLRFEDGVHQSSGRSVVMVAEIDVRQVQIRVE
jgi:hypothetical protein